MARKRWSWWKITQFVGVLLLAILCPFAALFSLPRSRKNRDGNTTVERELED